MPDPGQSSRQAKHITRRSYGDAPARTPVNLEAIAAEVAAQGVIIALLRLKQLILKYDSDQPRVPAGNPDGGQWTDEDGTGDGGSDGSPTSPTPAGYRKIPTPKDAVTYTTSDGTKFLAPPTADFQKVYQYGRNLRDKSPYEVIGSIRKAIGQGGTFDFQRNNGAFIKDYSNASNFAVGVLMNGAGFSRFDTDASGATYWLLFSTGDVVQQIKWWHYGYDAAQSGRLPKRNASLYSGVNWT